MGFTLKFFAWLSCIVIAVGAFFKVMHWPGANMCIVVGSVSFMFFYLPLWFFESFRQKKFRVFTVIQFVTLFLYAITALFKTMHWPFAGPLIYLFWIIILFVFIPSYLFKLKKNESGNFSSIHLGVIFVFVGANFLLYISGTVSRNTFESMSKSGIYAEKAYERLKVKNEHLYNAVYKIREADNSCYQQSLNLKKLTDSADNYIKNIKTNLISSADEISFAEADSIKIGDVRNKLNTAIPSRLFFEKKSNDILPIDELKKVINFFYDSATALINSENRQFILEGINLNTDSKTYEDGEIEDWGSANFDHVPVYDALTTLTSIQYEIKNAETQILADMLNKTSASSKENLAAQIADLGMKYETEKKQKEIELLQKDKELHDSKLASKNLEIEERENTIVIFIIITLLCSVLIFFIIRSNYLRKQANDLLTSQKSEIEKQKRLIEVKNIEITDSINYAQRIQKSILPPTEEISRILPNYFILFKPKDIVSGDFYWFSETNNKILIAVADCTGHGVPGAFMSTIGSEKLNEAATQSDDVSAILQSVNIRMKKVLHQSEKKDSTRDGMDIALCSFNKELTQLEYAGANRPIWIIRNGKNEIEEIKATKMAIGGLTNDEQIFTKHTVELQKGDTIYISTDGFADQFSDNDIKLMTKKFKNILISAQDKSMKDQQKFLDTFIENWKGNMEQTDDILVFGIRI